MICTSVSITFDIALWQRDHVEELQVRHSREGARQVGARDRRDWLTRTPIFQKQSALLRSGTQITFSRSRSQKKRIGVCGIERL